MADSTDPKKDVDQQEKVAKAPLPQKNAESPPVGQHAQHEEHLLDDALESTFPASDPVAEKAVKNTPEQEAMLAIDEEIVEHEEYLLDEALWMTFPASDPIAIPDPETVARAVSRQEHGHHSR